MKKNTYMTNASLCKMKGKGKKIIRSAPVQAIRKSQKIIKMPPLVIARPFFDLQPFF
jgi:hypothetical protein